MSRTTDSFAKHRARRKTITLASVAYVEKEKLALWAHSRLEDVGGKYLSNTINCCQTEPREGFSKAVG